MLASERNACLVKDIFQRVLQLLTLALRDRCSQNVRISPQDLGKLGHRISHFRTHFQKIKTVFMFRRWPFLQTSKEFWKIPFRCKVIVIFLNKGLLSPYNTPHACARRVVLANARSERHFKIQIGYFGYCQIPLNTEEITILPILIWTRRGLTRLWRNLQIWVKLARCNPLFLMKDTIP